MRNAIGVTAGIIKRNNRILIAQRLKGDTFEDKWEFPGGKIEDGETPEECLKRELHEEFEIESEIGSMLSTISYSYPELSIQLFVFEVPHFSGELRLNAHQDATWVDPKELAEYDLIEADKLVIAKIIGDI